MLKLITIPAVSVLLCSCVAPSMTIYGRGETGTRHGTKVVAVKEFQAYGDFDGPFSITGSVVSVHSTGPYTNSRMADVNWKGAHRVGRSIIQPLINWLGAGFFAGAAPTRP